MTTKLVKSKFALVCIHWRDAFDGENGWTDLEKYAPREATVATVGWLVPDLLKGYVTIVNSYFPDEIDEPKTVGMPVHIPLGMVIEIKVLEQPSFSIENLEEDFETLASSSSGHQPSQD